MSKYFLPLHFAVDQVLSISGYDFEHGKMPCKQKYCIKNMAVKISILILFHLRSLCSLKNHLFCILSLLQQQVVLIIQTLVDDFSSFQMVLGHFSSFQLVPQMVLVHFRSFQPIPHFSKYQQIINFILHIFLDIFQRYNIF